MSTLDILLFLVFNILFLHISAALKDCSSWTCGGNQPNVRFPFNREERQPERCGYPGFGLSCSSSGKTVIKLPSSGVFFVQDIRYDAPEIQLYDPDNCLPKRLLDLDLSGSPFEGIFYGNYTFLNCSSKSVSSPFVSSISCLSSPNHTVLALPSRTAARSTFSSCKLIKTASIPIPWPLEYSIGGSIGLGDNLRLTWSEPNCADCESRGGTCRFKSNTSFKTGCFDLLPPGQSRVRSKLPRGLALGLGIPFLMLTFVLVIYFCIKVSAHVQLPPPHHMPASAAVLPHHIIITLGLDRSTIESYPKVVLGESRRLPRADDCTCSICLSEYRSKETLRCIPECQHFFHADCIDKWLRLNATCPVCRKSPGEGAHAT